MKLSQLVTEYLTYKRALGYRFITEGFILQAFCRSVGELSLGDVRPDHFVAFFRTGHVERRHRAIKGLCHYAMGRYGELLPQLPQSRAVRPSCFVPHIYTREELKRLMQTATAICAVRQALIEDYVLRAILLLLYGAGLRLGEALALNVADVDLPHALLTIRQTKFHKTRLVPLGDDLLQRLIDYRREHDQPDADQRDCPFFCLRNGARVNHAVIERTFRRLRKEAGVVRQGGPRNQPRLHDLRHTAAVHRLISWYRAGEDMQHLLPKLATYLGHKDLSGTQRYLTLTPQLLHEASLRFERYALESHHD